MREQNDPAHTTARDATPPRQRTPSDRSERDSDGYTFWAFISYSRRDDKWTASLHRKLEAFRIPRQVAVSTERGFPAYDRIRPVFRDQDELTVESDLNAGLTSALDRSRFMILIASRASAASGYVDREVGHLVDAGRRDDIRIVALEEDVDGRIPLPPALANSKHEPLWLDARGTAKPSRGAVVRLVAGMLGVSFDALWRRDRRRRRQRFLTTACVILLAAVVVGAVLMRQRAAAENNKPERQIAAFRAYFSDQLFATDPTLTAADLNFEILRTDDFNGDNLIDFFVINQTKGWCGSGGCATNAYLTERLGQYRVVAELFSSTTPRTRASRSGPFREVVTTAYSVDAEPVYSIYLWTGVEYLVDHYEFCSGVHLEYCTDPMLITPVSDATQEELEVKIGARLLSAPKADAPIVRIAETHNGAAGWVVGKLAGGWYLVNVWKGESAFTDRSGIQGG